MQVSVFDERNCVLGEGLLWHPLRHQLFWFDIKGRKLLSRDQNQELEWQFDRHVSAAGWVNETELLIASERDLCLFDIETGQQTTRIALEADNPDTRSNDGRADPWGGFVIGTMGKQAEAGAGAIYRYYEGELRQLFSDITISNAICFAPDQPLLYFTDTATQKIQRVRLDEHGWPAGEAETFIDLTAEGLNPDGAVIDASGCMWNAQWGASRIAKYSPDGQFLEAVSFPAEQISCPAFGGADLNILFATSASDGITSPSPDEGRTYHLQTLCYGQPEHQIIL